MNAKTRLWSSITATLASGLMMSGAVNAVAIPCADATSTNYMQIEDTQASACLDSGSGSLKGDGGDEFLNETSGVGYTFLDKFGIEEDTGPLPGTGLFYTDDGKGAGTWGFNSSVWDSYGTIALGFKFGGGNDGDNWFAYGLLSGVTEGEWAYEGQGDGLSHMNIYGKDSVDVPEPGALALFGLGLLGLTLTRRKTRAS